MPTKYKFDYEDLRAQARGRWRHIFAALAPELEEAMEKFPRHVRCPNHESNDGFRLFNDYEITGGGVCSTCGSFPSGFRLLQWLKGWDFTQALAAVAEVINGGLPEIAMVKKTGNANGKGNAQNDERIRQRLRITWLNAVPLNSPLALSARLYLEHRGISPITYLSTGIRCHPDLRYFEPGKGELGRFPALLTLLRDSRGQAVTIHRTYLTKDGFKAPVDFPKQTMPYPSDMQLTGAVARLKEPKNGSLGIAEGLETTLAVMQATGQVCWAATTAALLQGAVLPQAIHKVTVWGDNDLKGAGQRAAHLLEERLKKEGREVEVNLPARPEEVKSSDWADVLVHQGPGGFPGMGGRVAA